MAVQPFTVPNQAGWNAKNRGYTPGVREDNVHFPISRLVILENTHNRCGGVPLSADYTRQVGELATAWALKLHIDGARIFNAAAALGVSAAELAAPCDSISFCLSKGLCAPVGSLLCGSNEFITGRDDAQTIGRRDAPGWRVGCRRDRGVGNMVDRLVEDHHRARLLAEKLSTVKSLQLTFGMPQTNMVFVNLVKGHPKSAEEVEAEMAKENVRVEVTGPGAFRLVTHYWITDEGVERAVQAFKRAV